MKIIILLMLFVSTFSEAGQEELSDNERLKISVVVENINATMGITKDCLGSLIIKEKGYECSEYKFKMEKLNKSIHEYEKINKSKKIIYYEIANNDHWYKSYRMLDRIYTMQIRIDKLNKLNYGVKRSKKNGN